MRDMDVLTIAYTPDSDDAFYYYAMETGRVPAAGFRPVFHRQSVIALNRAALCGQYDVTAISSIVYPQLADRYAILSVGTSVGRTYGPVLVSKRCQALEKLRGRRVGVGGIPTTGWFLLRSLCPEAVPVEMAYDRIADAVVAGELDAGVMIHEELVYYPRLGLRPMLDLGAEWCRRHHLPLPVGLNVIRRDLDEPARQRVCGAIRRSLQYGRAHRREALAWVLRFGRGTEVCTKQFVDMFANEDSVRMPPDVREALRVLFGQLVDQGLAGAVPDLDIVEGKPMGCTTQPAHSA
jgi:1,4-dihydroxy-6-naphthoate synthase